MTPRILFISSLIFFSSVLLLSCESKRSLLKDPEIHSNDELVDSLIQIGVDLFYEGNIEESQFYFESADSLITPKTDTSLKVSLLLNKTEVLKQKGEYEECLDNYFLASKLSKLTSDTFRLGLAYFNISSTFYLLDELEEAMKYCQLSQEIFTQLNEESRVLNCQLVKASIWSKKGDFQQAKESLDKAIQYCKKQGDNRSLSITYNNYGNLLINEELYSEAITYYQNAIEVGEDFSDDFSLAIRLGNIGEAYLHLNKLNEAKKFIDSSLQMANRVEAKETIYLNKERLVTYFSKNNEHKKALDIALELVELKTDLLKIESSNLVLSIEEKHQYELKSLESKNQIDQLEKDKKLEEIEHKQTQLWMFFFILVSIILIAVFYVIYKKQIKIRKIDAQLFEKEKEVLASNHQLAEEEKKLLQNELDFKRRELLSFSANLKEREDLLHHLKQVIQKIKPGKTPEKKDIDELKGFIDPLKNDKSIEIYDQIEKVNNSFHFELKTAFPELTKEDVRLASLLILGLSSKEISNLLSIEPKSVSMRRYRLKKKLNLDKSTDLIDFLIKI